MSLWAMCILHKKTTALSKPDWYFLLIKGWWVSLKYHEFANLVNIINPINVFPGVLKSYWELPSL